MGRLGCGLARLGDHDDTSKEGPGGGGEDAKGLVKVVAKS